MGHHTTPSRESAGQAILAPMCGPPGRMDAESDCLLHFVDAGILQRNQMLPVALEEVRSVVQLLRGGGPIEDIRLCPEVSPEASMPLPPGRPLLWRLAGSGLDEAQVAALVDRCSLLRAAYRPLACAPELRGLAGKAETRFRGWSADKRARSWSLSVRGVHQRPGLSVVDVGPALTEALQLLGPVCLDRPGTALMVLEEFEPKGARPLVLSRVWLVEVLGEKAQGWLKPYLLPTRPYLSMSTTEPRFAFLVANLAQISDGSAVLDPVCGSGGLLLAAAARGAVQLLGIDANAEVLEGRRSPPRSEGMQLATGGIHANFAALGLPSPKLVCGDALAADELVAEGAFHAVLADLPYGRLERARLHGPKALAAGLVRLAARALRPGGRAVMAWPEDLVADAPALAEAAGLQMVAPPLQCDLRTGIFRRLVVLRQPL